MKSRLVEKEGEGGMMGGASLEEIKRFREEREKEEQADRDRYNARPTSIVVCHITTWAGVAIGATHYYATLVAIKIPEVTQETVEGWGLSCEASLYGTKLTHPMTSSEAIENNKKLRETGHNPMYFKKGLMTGGFNNFKQIQAAAIKEYKKQGFTEPLVFVFDGNRVSELPDYVPKKVKK